MSGVATLEQVAGGFVFAEGPRWHDGAVHLSDIHDDAIKRVDASGAVTTVAELPGSPISLGFIGDVPIVSSMTQGKIWQLDGAAVSVRHDISALSPHNFGDIVVDAENRIYIANQGFDYALQGIPDRVDSPIFLIEEDGNARQVAGGFNYANGLAIGPDDRTLFIAETFGHRIVAMDISADGSLSGLRQLVQFEEGARPDGICCDAEGAVWCANALAHEVVRVAADGSITDRLSTGEDLAIGCILGGEHGLDLFVTTATTAVRDEARATRQSALWRTRALVPAGGRP